MPDAITKAFRVHFLKLYSYRYEEIYVRVDQFLDSKSSPRDIYDAHCHVLASLFRIYKYHCLCVMITGGFSTSVCLEAANYTSAVHNIHDKSLPKLSYYMTVIDGRHPRRSVEAQRREDGLSLAKDLLRMHYAFPV